MDPSATISEILDRQAVLVDGWRTGLADVAAVHFTLVRAAGRWRVTAFRFRAKLVE